MLLQSMYVSFILYIWFHTDALIEYSKLFKIEKSMNIDKWESYREINPRIGYLEYIRLKHSNFFIRLISCKSCLCFWVTLLICFIFGDILILPAVYIISYVIYNLISKY